MCRFWERLVRSVKIVLKKILGRATLDYDELLTVLIEIEGIINARPITYVYDDEGSVSYALSPSQLINGRRICSRPNSQHYEIVSTNASLTKRARRHKQILCHRRPATRVKNTSDGIFCYKQATTTKM